MLINLSNHPSRSWSAQQIASATEDYGEVSDIAFPLIDPNADSEEVGQMARDYLKQCLAILTEEDGNHAIHVMGEMTFVYAFVGLAQTQNLCCVASTSLRDVIEGDGVREVRFSFVQFRAYPSLPHQNC